MANDTTAAHVMVRNPITAQPWQPLSYIRQVLLINSFSYLPVAFSGSDGRLWYLVSDLSLAHYLRAGTETEARNRLSEPLETARQNGMSLIPAAQCLPDESIKNLLGRAEPTLVMVPNSADLIGILTPFDLL